jgi:integrase
MASVFKKTVTQRLPPDAKIDGDKVRWKARDGSWRTGKLIKTDLGERVSFKSPVWHCRYRNAAGRVIEESTRCRDKENAKQRLANIIALNERILAGVLAPSEADVALHRHASIDGHVSAYLKAMRSRRGKGRRAHLTAKHIGEYARSVKLVIAECRFKTLAEVTSERMHLWVSDCVREQEVRKWSNRTINAHVAAMSAFLNWCVESNRLTTSPLARFRKLDESASKHPRRALTEAELERLLVAARLRPIAEFGRKVEKLPKPDGKRTAWTRLPLTFETLEEAFDAGCETLRRAPAKLRKLKRLGEERCLIYRVLVTTGLRRGELESIRVRDIDFAAETITLAAEHDKAGRGATVALRSDIAAELREWIESRQLKPEAPALVVPDKLIRILDRDLIAANIPKIDERGRRIVVHSTRNTLATMLNKAGVAPRVVQEAMRHSDIRLTMQTYTDAAQLDVAKALEGLPKF